MNVSRVIDLSQLGVSARLIGVAAVLSPSEAFINNLQLYLLFVQNIFNNQSAHHHNLIQMSQYSVNKHTIIPLIFKIAHNRTLSYLIKDPFTSSLILLPSREDLRGIKHHIENIQHQFKCKLTHTFANGNYQIPQIFDQKIVLPQSQGQLRPELIGDISLCFIKASGYEKDYHLIAATHITPTSTKFPVLFVGNALSVCSIDTDSNARAKEYIETLDKLKYFPNQTYLFPQKKAALDDLQFSFAFEKSPFLSQKIQQFKEKHKELQDCLIPTSILQQKTMNPFFSPHKYSSVLQTSDKVASFELLREMRKRWRK